MNRHIKLTINSQITDGEYADIANMVWMILRNTRHDFHVELDGQTEPSRVNEAWTEYGDDADWR